MKNKRRAKVLIGLATSALVACSSTSTEDKSARERSELTSYLEEAFADAAAGGVVLVARGDEVLARRAFGLADLQGHRPMRVDDALPIGSITKSFTAAAILQAVDRGDLALDDVIRDLLPEAPVAGHDVTIEQLLSHTSGMPNLIDVAGFEDWAGEERTTWELVEFSRGMEWLAAPGSEFHYSDSGYILLGALLEELTLLDYDVHITQEVAAPLGLRATASAHRSGASSVKGYSNGGPPDSMHMTVPHAAGQLVASVDDLRLWIRAWEEGRVVSPALAEAAWSSRVLPDGTVSGYGFGWKRREFEGHALVGHGGWVPGFTAALLHLPEEELTAIVLVNDDDGRPEASYVARRALRLLITGSPYVREVQPSPERLKLLVGRYRTQRGTEILVESADEGRSLVVSWPDSPPVSLIALTDSRFADARSDGTWIFEFEGPRDEPARALRNSYSTEPRWLANRIE